MGISFLDRYNQEITWHGKVLVMNLYHLAMSHHFDSWTLGGTAEYFGCSVGLVSENLKLANAINRNIAIQNCKTRTEALDKLKKGKYASTMETKRYSSTNSLG